MTYATYLYNNSERILLEGLKICGSYKWHDLVNGFGCMSDYQNNYNTQQALMWASGILGGLILLLVVGTFFNGHKSTQHQSGTPGV